jgi:hypothetical protein
MSTTQNAAWLSDRAAMLMYSVVIGLFMISCFTLPA